MPRAARLHAIRDLRLEDTAEPPPPPEGWSTVAVTSVGICGSDLHWYAEGGTGEVTLDRPVVPGTSSVASRSTVRTPAAG